MKTIGIIAAMPSEVKDIRETLGEPEIRKIAGYDFNINKRGDVTVVNVCCGIGKVNSAVCAQVLIDSFKPDYLINCGIAGGMSADVKVCDIVISKDLMHHDLLPRFLAEYPPYHNTFEADEYLIKTAETVCAELGYKSHIGRIVSGEQFISDSAVKAQIVSEFSPLAVDMESSAVAHCAYRNSQPFVTIRCISDNADDEGEMTFDEFEKVAAKRVADVVLKIIDTVK